MQWAKQRNGKCYAILLEGEPIGSISLCEIDLEKQSASVGYWLASCQWAKGYATKAFVLLIEEAREMTIKHLTCQIHPQNKASLSMWKRQGATLTDDGDMIRPWLSLSTNTRLILSSCDSYCMCLIPL